MLEWIIKRYKKEIDADKTPIGCIPGAKDLDLESLDLTEDRIKELLSIDAADWVKEAQDIIRI